MKRNLIYHTHVPVVAQKRHYSYLANHKVHLSTLSRDGFSITCEAETLRALLPNTRGISPKTPVNFCCQISLQGLASEILTQCEAYAIRRLSRSEFQMSLKFAELDERQERMINAYMDRQLNASEACESVPIEAPSSVVETLEPLTPARKINRAA